MLVVVFVLWLALGIAGATIMGNKGRSAAGGFGLGFLLGPIGVIIALVMAADRREMELRSLSSGEMRKCPNCAELIRIEARKCRYCGSDVPLVDRN